MISCTRRLEWDAGHRVPLHESKCRSPHGHRYVAEITCRADELTPEGFVIDFGVVKGVVGEWIDRNLDHTMIAQTGDPVMEAMAGVAAAHSLRPFYWMSEPPTAECLAAHLRDVAAELLRGHHVEVVGVVVHETPNCRAESS